MRPCLASAGVWHQGRSEPCFADGRHGCAGDGPAGLGGIWEISFADDVVGRLARGLAARSGRLCALAAPLARTGAGRRGRCRADAQGQPGRMAPADPGRVDLPGRVRSWRSAFLGMRGLEPRRRRVFSLAHDTRWAEVGNLVMSRPISAMMPCAVARLMPGISSRRARAGITGASSPRPAPGPRAQGPWPARSRYERPTHVGYAGPRPDWRAQAGAPDLTATHAISSSDGCSWRRWTRWVWASVSWSCDSAPQIGRCGRLRAPAIRTGRRYGPGLRRRGRRRWTR